MAVYAGFFSPSKYKSRAFAKNDIHQPFMAALTRMMAKH